MPEANFEWTQSPFEDFLERHFKKLLITLIAAAVGVAAWLVIRQQSEKNAVRQAQAFTSAETLDDYKKVIANHPGTVAAGSAQLMIANLLAENNDISGALDELRKFTAGYPQHPMAEHAAFRIVALAEEKDGPEAGIRESDAFIERFPNSPLRPFAQLRKGDALAALGKREDAVALYDAMMLDQSLFGNTSVRAMAGDRAAKVKLQPPTEVEFVPEPEPDPATAPAPAAASVLDFDSPDPAEPSPILENETPAPDAEDLLPADDADDPPAEDAPGN